MYFHKLYVLIIIIFWFLKIVLKLPFMSRLFSSGCLKPLMFTLITFNLQNNSYFTLYFYFIPYPWYVLWMMRNRFVSLHPVIRIEPLTFTATLKPNVTWFLCVKYMFLNYRRRQYQRASIPWLPTLVVWRNEIPLPLITTIWLIFIKCFQFSWNGNRQMDGRFDNLIEEFHSSQQQYI